MASCGSSKKLATRQDNLQKLEGQYQLYQGVKYKFGGIDKRGFDCSGFVYTVYNDAFNVPLPRTTEAMGKLGHKVTKNSLRPGDLVFFRPTRKYRHVGIYINDNTFIHSSTSKGITKSKLDNPYWKKKFRFAKRILNNK